MHQRTLLFLGTCLLLAACSTPPSSTARNGGPPPSGAAANAAWYGEYRVPPQGYLMTDQNPLVGRTVEDSDNDHLGSISYVLYPPSAAANDASSYVAVSDRSYYGYLVLPMSGLRVDQNGVWAQQTRPELLAERHFSLAELEEHYPPTNMRQHILMVPPTPYGGLPPVTSARLPPVAPTAGPLALAWRGGAAGAPVYDSTGAYVGIMAGSSVEPATGVVRYAIISGPTLGVGDYIAVPASSAQYVNGRVVLNAPLSTWQQMPHYQAAQLQQTYGAAGVIQ